MKYYCVSFYLTHKYEFLYSSYRFFGVFVCFCIRILQIMTVYKTFSIYHVPKWLVVKEKWIRSNMLYSSYIPQITGNWIDKMLQHLKSWARILVLQPHSWVTLCKSFTIAWSSYSIFKRVSGTFLWSSG